MAPKDLVRSGAAAGISRFVDPLLQYPLDPLLLVEGKYDKVFLVKAFALLGEPNRLRIACLEDLTAGRATGGVQNLQRYLSDHAEVIKSRPGDASVILLLDWDAATKASEFHRIGRRTGGRLRAKTWPEGDCNPALGKSFRGIERFYSDRLISAAEKKTEKIFRNVDGLAAVTQDGYGEVKAVLAQLVQKELRERDLKYARKFLRQLLQAMAL